MGFPLTGARVADSEIVQPAFWRRHIREAVRFSAGMDTLHREGIRIFLEVGPAEKVYTEQVRFRTVGDATCTGCVRSDAATEGAGSVGDDQLNSGNRLPFDFKSLSNSDSSDRHLD